jgi:hypothetical protein
MVLRCGMPQFYDLSYDAIVGSDMERDGMFLEIRDKLGQTAAEVFYSDRTSEMTFTAYVADLPATAVEWMIETARSRLVPPE